MPVSIRQIHPVFVGEVSGVDLTQPLSQTEVEAVRNGIDTYAVLVFRDQKLTDEQQMAFSLNFGEIENARGGNITKDKDQRLARGMNDVSNLGKDGKPLPKDSRQHLFNIGNMLWHSDPETAETLLGQAKHEVRERYHRYQQLAALDWEDSDQDA